MSALDTFFDEIVAGTDAILLFSPDAATVEEFEAEDTPTVVVDQENDVGADQFVELPLPFRDVTGRLRFGLEGAIR
ncbi:MAG: hypothetical protein BRD23_03450, partial [Halobacteriales archaeon SW_9_67_25]